MIVILNVQCLLQNNIAESLSNIVNCYFHQNKAHVDINLRHVIKHVYLDMLHSKKQKEEVLSQMYMLEMMCTET